MGGLVMSGLSAMIQGILSGALGLLAQVLSSISHYSLTAAQQPWVQGAIDVSVAVTGGLLLLNLTYRALTEYVLWNEGSSSDVTGTLGKGLMRVAFYGLAGTTLAYGVFNFGIELAAAYMSAPMASSVHVTHALTTDIASAPGVAIGTVLFLLFGVVGAVVAIIIVTLQMAVRGAELVYYVVAAPIVALGQFNRDGGVWSGWWRGLVVLSLSQAVQWLGLKGMLASVQPLMDGIATSAGAAAAATPEMFLVILLMLGWAWATVRGPHLLQQWSYRSGLASAGGYVGGVVLNQGGGARAIMGLFGRGGS